MNESKQSSLSSFSPHNDPVASIQSVLHTSSVQAESSFVQEANAFRVAHQHHVQHNANRRFVELDVTRSHQCCPVDHEGRTVAINDIKAAGIAHVLRVDQGSARYDEAQAKTTRSAHPDPEKSKIRTSWIHWFMFCTDQDIDYLPHRPAGFLTLEDHTLFIHVNTKTQQEIQTISAVRNSAPGGPSVIFRCLLQIWKAGDHEWRTIQYGDAEVIEGESLVLSLCKGGLEPCWVLASSLREKGYKFLSQKTNPTT